MIIINTHNIEIKSYYDYNIINKCIDLCEIN